MVSPLSQVFLIRSVIMIMLDCKNALTCCWTRTAGCRLQVQTLHMFITCWVCQCQFLNISVADVTLHLLKRSLTYCWDCMSNYMLKRVLQLNVAPKQAANSFRYHRFYISNKLKWYSVINKNFHQFLVSNLFTVSSHDCSPKRVVMGWFFGVFVV